MVLQAIFSSKISNPDKNVVQTARMFPAFLKIMTFTVSVKG